MGTKISICGKGGSGKSTLASLLANAAYTRGLRTLVVDSDESNSGLYRMLGFDKPPIPLMALVGGKEGIKEKMETIGVIFYDASVFLSGLKGDTLTEGRATRQAGEILESLLTAKT